MSNLLSAHVTRLPVTTSTVPCGGASIVAYDGGSRDPSASTLVFLHAGVCDSRLWARQFDAFGASHRVVAYDRRGFGATAMVDEDFRSVDDLWAVMDALAIDRAVLVGCSQGGRIALDAALARPERVERLVLVASAFGGAPEATIPDPRMAPMIETYEKAKASGDIAAQNRVEAHVWLDGPFSAEGRVAGDERDLFLAMNEIVLSAPKSCSATIPESAWKRLPEVAMPTLLVWGTLDVPSVIVNMRHAAKAIPDARAHELAGTAHLPSLEAPDRFNATLSAFLDEEVGAPAGLRSA